MQETHRNITRLIEAGMVLKDSDGQHMLTPYGKTIVQIIPSLTFLFEQREYFIEHDTSDLPVEFVQRIGSLGKCEVVAWGTRHSTEVEELVPGIRFLY